MYICKDIRMTVYLYILYVYMLVYMFVFMYNMFMSR